MPIDNRIRWLDLVQNMSEGIQGQAKPKGGGRWVQLGSSWHSAFFVYVQFSIRKLKKWESSNILPSNFNLFKLSSPRSIIYQERLESCGLKTLECPAGKSQSSYPGLDTIVLHLGLAKERQIDYLGDTAGQGAIKPFLVYGPFKKRWQAGIRPLNDPWNRVTICLLIVALQCTDYPKYEENKEHSSLYLILVKILHGLQLMWAVSDWMVVLGGDMDGLVDLSYLFWW